jgi:hypothetical protein
MIKEWKWIANKWRPYARKWWHGKYRRGRIEKNGQELQPCWDMEELWRGVVEVGAWRETSATHPLNHPFPLFQQKYALEWYCMPGKVLPYSFTLKSTIEK